MVTDEPGRRCAPRCGGWPVPLLRSSLLTSLRATVGKVAGFCSETPTAPGPPCHNPSPSFFPCSSFPRGSFFFTVLSHIPPASGRAPFLSPGSILRPTHLLNLLSVSHQASSCAGWRSSRNKRSGTWWAMTWPPSCLAALLWSTVTQKMTPLSLMRTTGRISSFCLCLPPLFSSYLPFVTPPPAVPGESGEGKNNFKGQSLP